MGFPTVFIRSFQKVSSYNPPFTGLSCRNHTKTPRVQRCEVLAQEFALIPSEFSDFQGIEAFKTLDSYSFGVPSVRKEKIEDFQTKTLCLRAFAC